MDELITKPLALNSTVSFSKISTKISFFMFFLSVICDRGLCMAVDGIVLGEKMLGLKLLVCCLY